MELTDEYTWIVDPIDGTVREAVFTSYLVLFLISLFLSRYLQVRRRKDNKRAESNSVRRFETDPLCLLFSMTSFVHTL